MEELNFAPNEAEKRLENQSVNKENAVKDDLLDLNSTFNVIDTNTTDAVSATYDLEKATDLKALCSLQQNIDFLDNEKKYNEIRNYEPPENKFQTSDGVSNQITCSDTCQSESVEESPNSTPINENVESHSNVDTNSSKQDIEIENSYENTNFDTVDIDYSQFVDVENAKNSLEYDGCRNDSDYINIIDKHPNSDEDNIFEILADIRFSGPTDSQLMSTSFSESNTCDEKEWDSGSDSRSSSSGEFIWKVSRKWCVLNL